MKTFAVSEFSVHYLLFMKTNRFSALEIDPGKQ